MTYCSVSTFIGLFLATIISGETLAIAQELPQPPSFPGLKIPEASQSEPFFQSITLGDFVIDLETTPLNEIRERTGRGQMGKRGDASTSLEWLCYSVPKQRPNAQIWFMSGEIHGGTVGNILITYQKPGSPKCPDLPNEFLPVNLSSPIWLGAQKRQVIESLGPPSGGEPGVLQYVSERSLSGELSGFIEWQTIHVFMGNNSVSEIWINKITTN